MHNCIDPPPKNKNKKHKKQALEKGIYAVFSLLQPYF